MQIGKRIYFDKTTGNILADIGERSGSVVETDEDHDISVYKTLSERIRDTFDFIELEYGQYAQDFAECSGYRVNPDTLALEFLYLDPSLPEPEVPVYRAPLSEEVKALKVMVEEKDRENKNALFEIYNLLGGE